MPFSSFATGSFWRSYNSLPTDIRRQAEKQFELFSSDPSHPSLRLKPVGAVWSVRVSKSYRALARRRGDASYWIWIGAHADYDKLLDRKA
jgi:hypothetical protein